MDRHEVMFARQIGRGWIIVALLAIAAILPPYIVESVRVRAGELVVRMQPLEVKVFATSRVFETGQRAGRDYAGE